MLDYTSDSCEFGWAEKTDSQIQGITTTFLIHLADRVSRSLVLNGDIPYFSLVANNVHITVDL